MRTRSPIPSPSPPPRRARSDIVIRHPGCISANILLTFCATDDVEDAIPDTVASGNRSVERGVAWDVVYWACAIVTGNRFDCYLTRTSDPAAERVWRPSSGVLPSGDYWLQVPRGNATASLQQLPYAIVPNFRSWTFPMAHNFERLLRTTWSDSIDDPGLTHESANPLRMAVRSRDQKCLVTASNLPLEVAHLIPTAEESWWQRHQFSPGLDSDVNCILLRQDVHTNFDATRFSIVPKPLHSPSTKCAPTIHVWSDGDPKYHQTWHNLRLRQVRGIDPMRLFARFAFDVFPMLRPFLQAGQVRRLLVLDEFNFPQAKSCNGEQCKEYYEQRVRGKSGSPTKRARPSASVDRQDAHGSMPRSFDSGIGWRWEEESEGELEDRNETEVIPRGEDWRYTTDDIAAEHELWQLEHRGKRKRHRQEEWEEDEENDAAAEQEETSRGRSRKSKKLNNYVPETHVAWAPAGG
ncbi:Hypothetical predicted protein [Lecanosticta acicola]|uniref:HNH nuclease domain-containing protein n=1 Tax=Lecanosticta acicola TaxID=111012 RepID=A0AAI8Z5U6_9PEZI|nr:Hypothetical predicted protein [Lecanosticta acicola]